MPRNRPSRLPHCPRIGPLACLVLALSCLASNLTADWLVTRKGQLIETQGPWTIEDTAVHFVDVEGADQSLELDDLDLEGSYDTTEWRTGKPVARQSIPALDTAPEADSPRSPASVRQAQVILYETSWCGYCRKARRLLKSLDVDFVAKNIEHDREAALELRGKVGRHRGVPVLDIGGTILRGYHEGLIRDLVAELRSKAAKK